MSLLKFHKHTNFEVQLSDGSYDTVDKPPDSHRVSRLSLVLVGLSILLHFIDLGVDMYVAYSYASSGRHADFAWTVAFILSSAIIINLVSATMYAQDRRKGTNTRPALIRISLCLVGIPIQSAPLIRYSDSFWYAIKSIKAESKCDPEQQQKYFIKMLNEDSDAALLRIFECYLESAPQLILQTTLLVKDYIQGHADHQTGQLILIVLGLTAMAWGMANYHRCIRLDQEDKENISVLGLAVQFFWHLSFTASRVLTIVAVAILFTFWSCAAVVCHWCVMTIWIAISSNSKFCGKNKILEIFFCGVVGLIYIFNFINLNEGPTRQSYILFYTLCFAENLIAATIWGVTSISVIKNWVYYVFTILPVFCFLLSVILLFVYYHFMHPNRAKGCRNGGIQTS